MFWRFQGPIDVLQRQPSCQGHSVTAMAVSFVKGSSGVAWRSTSRCPGAFLRDPPRPLVFVSSTFLKESVFKNTSHHVVKVNVIVATKHQLQRWSDAACMCVHACMRGHGVEVVTPVLQTDTYMRTRSRKLSRARVREYVFVCAHTCAECS